MSNSGMSLIEILVCATFLGLGSWVANSINLTMFKLNANFEINIDRESLKFFLAQEIAVAHSLEKSGIDDTSQQCPSDFKNQQGPWIQVWRQDFAGVYRQIGRYDSLSGEISYLNWRIRISCSDSSQTLVIKVAKKSASGAFDFDPINKVAFDFEHPMALLYTDKDFPMWIASSGIGQEQLTLVGGDVEGGGVVPVDPGYKTRNCSISSALNEPPKSACPVGWKKAVHVGADTNELRSGFQIFPLKRSIGSDQLVPMDTRYTCGMKNYVRVLMICSK
jgi:hypothetical protein